MSPGARGDFDVVVVGAGPGGSAAAIGCSREGLKVLLLEREELPRRKVCGGGLSAKALDALPVPVDTVLERRVSWGWVASGPERAFRHELRRPGAMVCRERLDALLARSAREAGATLLDGCAFVRYAPAESGRLSVETAEGKVTTRLLVGADGVHSRVRRQLLPGAKIRAVPAVEARIAPPAGVLDALAGGLVLDFGALDGGYGWIFPKADHLNVGLYRFRKTPASVDLRDALRRFMEAHPFLRGGRVLDVSGAMIPVAPVSPTLARDGVLLAGDAAGLGEAMFGEGISFALRSGREAAAAAAAHLRSGAPLALYSRRMARTRRDLLVSRLTAAAFYRLGRAGFERLVRSPYASRLFSAVVTGALSARGCLVRTLLGAPLWLLESRLPAGPLGEGGRPGSRLRATPSA